MPIILFGTTHIFEWYFPVWHGHTTDLDISAKHFRTEIYSGLAAAARPQCVGENFDGVKLSLIRNSQTIGACRPNDSYGWGVW